jgi:hypothetical protein
MYRDGIIPLAAAHGKAAFPIGVGTNGHGLRSAGRQDG